VIGGHLNAPWRANTFEEKAQLCAACHGENGIPPDKSTPVIWGQHQGYLYLQLRDYKRGTRKDDVMSPVVDLLERACTLGAKPRHMCDPANMTGRSIGYGGHRQSSMPVHPAGPASKM
jgi:hypothetical protein